MDRRKLENTIIDTLNTLVKADINNLAMANACSHLLGKGDNYDLWIHDLVARYLTQAQMYSFIELHEDLINKDSDREFDFHKTDMFLHKDKNPQHGMTYEMLLKQIVLEQYKVGQMLARQMIDSTDDLNVLHEVAWFHSEHKCPINLSDDEIKILYDWLMETDDDFQELQHNVVLATMDAGGMGEETAKIHIDESPVERKELIKEFYWLR